VAMTIRDAKVCRRSCQWKSWIPVRRIASSNQRRQSFCRPRSVRYSAINVSRFPSLMFISRPIAAAAAQETRTMGHNNRGEFCAGGVGRVKPQRNRESLDVDFRGYRGDACHFR
jgi:hypothetical protein